MRIAILYFQDAGQSSGGGDTYALNLSRSLAMRGYEVSILNLFSTPREDSLWRQRLKRAIYSIFILYRTPRLRHYDIVFFHEPLYPHNLILLRCLKFLTKSHIIIHIFSRRIKSRLYFTPIRWHYPAIISGEIARLFARSIATKVGLVLPGIDITKFRPLDIDKKWDLLYIGHLFREKGVCLLLKAMKWLKDNGSTLKLKIIHGPSAEERFYRRYINDNNLDNVDIEEMLITDLVSVYNSARVFVYPGISYNRVVTVPLTILEASACGLPVVCTSLYRHRELPNITFTEPDAESLGSALIQTVGNMNPEKCEQTIDIIHNKYSPASMGAAAESFFLEVMNAKHQS